MGFEISFSQTDLAFLHVTSKKRGTKKEEKIMLCNVIKVRRQIGQEEEAKMRPEELTTLTTLCCA